MALETLPGEDMAMEPSAGKEALGAYGKEDEPPI